MDVIAILIECDHSNTLGGSCSRDVIQVAKLLRDMCNVPTNNIAIIGGNRTKMLCKSVFGAQAGASMYLAPSDRGILTKALNQCLSHCHPTTLYIHISGHGYQTSDDSKNGDEVDGLDEYIILGDSATTTGQRWRDDDLLAWLKTNVLRQQIKAVLLTTDTCHSGTMWDLPYIYIADIVGDIRFFCTDMETGLCEKKRRRR